MLVKSVRWSANVPESWVRFDRCKPAMKNGWVWQEESGGFGKYDIRLDWDGNSTLTVT